MVQRGGLRAAEWIQTLTLAYMVIMHYMRPHPVNVTVQTWWWGAIVKKKEKERKRKRKKPVFQIAKSQITQARLELASASVITITTTITPLRCRTLVNR